MYFLRNYSVVIISLKYITICNHNSIKVKFFKYFWHILHTKITYINPTNFSNSAEVFDA